MIRAEGLGKKYVIGHQAAERVPTLRDAISRSAHNLVRTSRDLLRGKPLISGDEVEEFWALKNVDFEIRRGDVVGIIGRNGAGKSTLLKILSRITEPSEGRVEIRGRVASLLEVGTGFHPELTGRENIFLNGAILGMSRADIRRKFDEIVAFAEIEKFLDTPVKRYSSGMYVRLAFAVAAHLEPEILIVDEVLAVGDAEFQKKCLGKMQDVAGVGRTVLFVSHNTSAIAALCTHGILLNNGIINSSGPVNDVIDNYQKISRSIENSSENSTSDGDWILVLKIVDDICKTNTNLRINCSVYSPQRFSGSLNVYLKDSNFLPVGAFSIGGMGSDRKLSLDPGSNSFSIKIELPRLAEGSYVLDFEFSNEAKNRMAWFESAIVIPISPSADLGCTEVLRQAWGYGSLWPEAGLL
ncbi:ABC transporter ATP-binding protein [Porphyrobacter sp. SLTP]|uniref:ABC transporter ATP-binding protein n=1 Tax=Porphyrobacter sp. SLTP TaxID=2683266 RepID=UPI0018F8CA5F